jgi:lipoprotein LpqH
MNIKPVTLGSAALAASAAVALFLTGCSSNDSTTSSSATQSPAAGSASAAAPAAPSGGGSSATVDGKRIDASFTTTCAEQGGTLALALADANNGTYGRLAVTATITGGGNTVQAVGIAGSKGGSNGVGYALGYGNGMPGGSASVSKSGNTYTVSGSGVGALDPTNPMAGPSNTKFAITFACPSIIGG